MNKYKTMDANEAVANIAYKFSELCGIYPITPASPMAEKVDLISTTEESNFFGSNVKVVEMQSEAGAAALVHGALNSGVLASTFTASQGLLLMIPTLYKLAGEMLPAVLHVAARSLSTHALSIFGDHQDIYATRQTGVCLLASSNPKEAYHMAAISHLSAIKGSLPFIHFFDGFRTSHEINKIKLIDYSKLEKLIDKKALDNFRNRQMSNINPNTRGTAENDDIYFQHTESRNTDYQNIIEIVEEYMNKFNKIENTNYKPFNYYGSKKAKYVIVAMGSVCNTIRELLNYLKDDTLGLIEVHLYRPFSSKHLLEVLPKTVTNIAVLDRTKEPGSNGEPLYLDIVNALKEKDIKVIGGRYGLSSKNTTSKDVLAVYNNLKEKNKNNFTIGINDDVTKLSLKTDDKFKIETDNKEYLFYGFGSDGMVSTSKDMIKILGDNTRNYVQGYFQYDSKKSGGVTRSHIRISKEEILSSYYVDNPELVVISKDNYIYRYDVLDNIKENGMILLNTNLEEDKLIQTLPNKIKKIIADKNLSLFTIDAYKIANELGLKNKISTCMEVCIFKIINILPISKVKQIMKQNNETRFKHKGKKIIDINNKIVEVSDKYLHKIDIDSSWSKLKIDTKEELNFYEIINNLKGDTLPVSAFLDKKQGIVEAGTVKQEKREVTEDVPCWIKENCIQCGKCAIACPHAVIRPYLTSKDEQNIESIPSLVPKDTNYTISISYKDCTGCGVCVNACPGKAGKKALEMKKYNKEEHNQEVFDYLEKNNLNEEKQLPVLNSKNISLKEPKFEFSGACAGCGETPYLTNLTRMFNDNLIIANATGCSSIYSASMPSTAYSIPWASSLFEDNAEYGLGIKTGINLKRQKIKKYMEDNKCTLFKKWLDNMNDYTICKEVQDKIDYEKHPYLEKLKDNIVPKSMWIVGGDGFAYDIGYGGLDHILSTNENINILVLDTEVYSNTGGQSSKSSNLGSIASFTATGKRNYKKDLARIAMCYPHVYVASTNIGYNPEQYLKVLEEASKHNGPSLIIAYSPCIEHGIKTGMEHSQTNAYLATKCGYFPTFRYNPNTNKFTLDSKNVEFDKYEQFLMTENRYASLKSMNENECKEILEEQKNWAIARYNYYKKQEEIELDK